MNHPVSEQPPQAAVPQIPRGLVPADPSPVELFSGFRHGLPRLIGLLKRTYDVDMEGYCSLADEQEVVFDGAEAHGESVSGLIPPPWTDEDTLAFRKATDVVVQGSAQTYGAPAKEVVVEVAGPQHLRRALRVTGDRFIEVGPNGGTRISEPEPFETMPITYDRAFGGLDQAALDRFGDIELDVLALVAPELLPTAVSRWHYPRNPCGTGYLAHRDSGLGGVRVPNVSFAHESFSAETFQGRGVLNWTDAPFPAGMDWFRGDWFPRCAYLGVIPDMASRSQLHEIVNQWAPPDLLDTPDLMADDETPARVEYAQGASPGMTVRGVRPDARFELRHLHPLRQRMVVTLPGEVPSIGVAHPALKSQDFGRHLNSVVLRPDQNTVVMTWRVDAELQRPLSPEELLDLDVRTTWAPDPSSSRR